MPLPAADIDRLDLPEVAGGTRLRLRVKPGSRRTEVLGIHGAALKLAVVAPPERGKANRAVLRLLARVLDLAPSDLELIHGQGSPDKTVLVPLLPREVAARLLGDGR